MWGRKGIRLAKYALTHADERVTADMLKGGKLLDLISKEAGKKINVYEEIRLVKHRFLSHKHIFIILEPEKIEQSAG